MTEIYTHGCAERRFFSIKNSIAGSLAVCEIEIADVACGSFCKAVMRSTCEWKRESFPRRLGKRRIQSTIR